MNRKRLRLITALVIFFCGAAVWLYWQNTTGYKFADDAYYPVADTRIEIAAGTKAGLEKETGIAQLRQKDAVDTDFSQLCIYLKNREAIVLTCPMAVYPYSDSGKVASYKLTAFTEVQHNHDNCIIEKNGRSELCRAMFLFNGENTYVLLSDAVLQYADKSIALPALSYVIACTDQWVQYMDYGTGEYTIDYLEQGSRVELNFEKEGFAVHADLDRCTFEGKDYMFVTRPSYLPGFFEK